MTTKAQKVLEDALTLERTERADLAASLLDSLDETEDAEAEAAYTEIERRMKDVDTGLVTTVSWPEARQRRPRAGSGLSSALAQDALRPTQTACARCERALPIGPL